MPGQKTASNVSCRRRPPRGQVLPPWCCRRRSAKFWVEATGPRLSDQLEDRAHGSRQQNDLAAAHRVSRIGVALVDCAFVPRPLQHRGPIAADDPSHEVRFFSASPNDPPMRPVPMMVIWRVAIGVRNYSCNERSCSQFFNRLPRSSGWLAHDNASSRSI